MRRLRTRSVLGGAVVLALGACAHTPARDASVAPPTSPPVSASSAPSGSAAAGAIVTTRDNVETTRRFASRLLHAVPMPASAREWKHSPTAHYRQGTLGIGPSDPHLGRTTWWTVPLTGTALDSWLRRHTPHGLTAESGSGGSVQSGGVWERDLSFRAPSTAAHTRGWVNFAFMPDGRGLVVRVDTFVGARFARTVLVPTDTTSVTIRRTGRSLGRHQQPRTAVRTVTDARAVADLVAMVNGLPGAMTVPFVASCPDVREDHSYAMTFAGPHGSYVASLPTTMCWPAVALSHDGLAAGPPLEPGRRFTRYADRYLA